MQRLISVAILVASLGCTGMPAWAEGVPADAALDTITVPGHASRRITLMTVQLRVPLKVSAKEAEDASTKFEKLRERVQEVLTEASIPADRISEVGFVLHSVVPGASQMVFNAGEQQKLEAETEVVTEMRVELRQEAEETLSRLVARVAALIDALAKVGADHGPASLNPYAGMVDTSGELPAIEVIAIPTDEERRALAEAAMADATRRAKALANAAGVQVGRVRRVVEKEVPEAAASPFVWLPASTASKQALVLTQDVEVTFDLLPAEER